MMNYSLLKQQRKPTQRPLDKPNTTRAQRPMAAGARTGHWLLGGSGALLALLLLLPVLVLLLRGLQAGGLHNLPQPELIGSAVTLSLRTSLVSVLLIALLGTPLAYILGRWRFPGRRLLSVLTELPLVLPPAVAGLALLLTFGRRGALGGLLLDVGISIPFTSLAVILAQVFVAAPLYVRAAQLGFSAIPDELLDAARVDGATELETLRRIMLPLALRAMGAGLILSWARAMGEFGATILFAGNIQGRTQTMPLLVYQVFNQDMDAAIWTGLLLIGIALVALLLSRWLGSRQEEGW